MPYGIVTSGLQMIPAAACGQLPSSLVYSETEASGSVGSSSVSTMTDVTQNWSTNQFAGYTLQNFTTNAPGTTVLANSSHSLTFASGSIAFTAGDNYNIFNYTNQFAWQNYGLYNLEHDNFGKQAGTLTQWINGPGCWGVIVASLPPVDPSVPNSYCHVSRGWSNNTGLMNTLSSGPGGNSNDWTTQAGMGVQVGSLTKSHVGWNFFTPQAQNSNNTVGRWDALIDVYLHLVQKPDPSIFPPQHDIQIMHSLSDQPLVGQPPNKSGFWAASLAGSNGFIKTISGVTYAIMIDNQTFNQPGGHTFTLFTLPTMFSTPGTTGLLWGQQKAVHDVAGIIAFFNQNNPRDDSNNPIKLTNGTVVSSPLILSTDWLTSINAGLEPNFCTPGSNSFTSAGFFVAMQNEADGSLG